MQIFRSAPVPLPLRTGSFILLGLLALSSSNAFAAAPKVHAVALGTTRWASYTPPESAASAEKAGAGKAAGRRRRGDSIALKIRPLIVDGRQKEWTSGEAHDVTDRSFTIRRVLRLNDSLPGEGPRWSWQPGPWLMVDRITGHITALHLPDFDTQVSDAVWYRDYAAYCGVAMTAKGGLFAIVAQLGARRAVVQKQLGKWPLAEPVEPVCKPAHWQRSPMRVTMQPTGGDATTFDVVGAASLIEEGDNTDSSDNN
ncbi:MAG: hypothetical protein P4K80_08285 [Acidobacteriaceae bacterium]|nr:hypothetical protein [Acidobacteriaceae bacterium]